MHSPRVLLASVGAGLSTILVAVLALAAFSATVAVNGWPSVAPENVASPVTLEQTLTAANSSAKSPSDARAQDATAPIILRGATSQPARSATRRTRRQKVTTQTTAEQISPGRRQVTSTPLKHAPAVSAQQPARPDQPPQQVAAAAPTAAEKVAQPVRSATGQVGDSASSATQDLQHAAGQATGQVGQVVGQLERTLTQTGQALQQVARPR